MTLSTICDGDTPTFEATFTPGATYQFYIEGIPVSSGAVSGNYLLTSLVTRTLEHNDIIGVEITNSNGCSSSATITLSVNAFIGSDVITTTTTSYCSGADPTIITEDNSSSGLNGGNITYRWQTRTSSPVATAWQFTNLPATVTPHYNPPILADGVHHFRRVTFNELNTVSCTNNVYSNVVTITVGSGSAPTLTVTLTNTVTSNQVTSGAVCDGEGIIVDASGSTGNGYEFILNTATVQGPSSVSSYTFPAFSNGDTIQVRVFENSDGTGCFTDYFQTIRVNSISGNNRINPSDQEICYEGDPTLITSISTPTHNVIGGSVSFQWQKRPQGTANWSNIGGAVVENYDPPSGQLTSTTEFRRIAFANYNGLVCSDNSSPSHTSNIVTVSVVAAYTATLTTLPNPPNICEGDPVTIEANAVGGANYEFFVDGQTQGAPSGVRTLSGVFNNGQQITVAISVSSCTITSDPITIITNPNPISTLTAVGVVSNTICENNLPTITANPVGNFSYTFFINDLPAPPAAVTTNSLDLSLLPSVSNPIKIDVTVLNNLTGCSNTTTTTNDSSLILSTNSLTGSNTIGTGTVSYCSGSDPVVINRVNNPTPTAGGTLNFQWQTRTPALTATWTTILNADEENFDPNSSIGDGVHEFRRLVTSKLNNVDCTPDNSIYFSNTVTITIGGDAGSSPPVSLSSTISPSGSNVICEGEDVIFTATSNASATWYEFFIRGQSKGISASNTLDTSTASVTLLDNTEIRVRVYTGVATGTGCFNDAVMTIRVNSMSGNNIISYAGADPICGGENPDIIQGISNPISDLASITGEIEYEWQINEGLGWQDIFNSDSEDYNPPVLTTTSAYRRLATAKYGSSKCTVPSSIYISNVVTITVNPGPAPSAVISTGLTSDTFCSTTNSLTLDASLSSDANSYLFYHNGNPILSLPASSTSFTTTDTIKHLDTFTVRAYAGANRTGCFDETSVTVFSNQISGTNQIGPNLQELCDGEDPVMIGDLQTPTSNGTSTTFEWEIRPIGGAWGEILGATSASHTPTVLGNGSAYRRAFISTLNGVECKSYSNIVTITIDTSTTTTAVLNSDKLSHTICSTETGTILFTADPDPSASRYEFYVGGILEQSSNVSRTFELPRLSIVDGLSVSVRVYNGSALDCYDEDEVTVRINDLQAGTITGTQSVCQTSTNTILLNTLSSGTINGVPAVNGDYQWQHSTDNSNWTDIALNANNASYIIPFNSTHPTRYYRRLVSGSLLGVPCSAPTASVKITVSPNPAPGLTSNIGGASTNITVCSSNTLNFTASGGQSFRFLVRGVPELTTDADPGLSTYNFDPVAEGVLINDGDEVSVIVYNKPLIGGNPDPTACSSTSTPITVNIQSNPNATINTDKLNNIICDDESFTLTATAGGIGGATYVFIINSVIAETITTTATQTTVSFTPPLPYTSSITISVEVTTPSGCVSTASLIVLENTITAGTISPTNQNICSGEIPSIISGISTPTISSGATASYYWQSSTDGFATFNNIMIDSEDYQPPALTQTVEYRRVDVSNLNGKTCSATTAPVTVAVNDAPNGSLRVNGSDTASITLCIGDTPLFTITGGVASNSYTFRIDGGFDTHTNTPTFDPVALGFVFAPGVTYSVDAAIYDRPLVAGNPDPTACETNTSSIDLVTSINPAVAINITGATNETFCSGDNVEFTVTNPPAADVTNYHFILNGITTIQNGASDTTSRSTLNDGDTITAEVTLVSGCVVSATVTLIENSITAGTISPVNQTICSGATPTIITGVTTPTVNPAANVTHYWQASTDGFATFNNIMINSEDYQHPSGITTTTQFRRVDVSELFGKTCSATTVPVTVSVSAPPVGNLLVDGAATASVTICTGDTPIFTITGGVASNSYTFKIDGGFDTHTNTPTFDPVALGFVFAPGVTYSVDATIYDRPLSGANPDPAACTNNTSSITIISLNAPAVAIAVTGATNETFCSGDNVTFEVTSPNVGVTNYHFILNGITTIQNGASDTTSRSTLNDGDTITAEVTLVSGCVVSATVTLIENSITAGTISPVNQSICSGATPTIITGVTTPTVNPAANVTHYWQASTDGFATFNNIMINSEDYQHPSGITTTTQFRRVDVSELFGKTCSATTVPVTVSVSAPPVGNLLVNGAATASVTICTGDTPIFTITGGVASNSYTFKIDGGFDTHTNTPTFDPVALGFVFAPGVTYSVDATIYDRPLQELILTLQLVLTTQALLR